jgi:hypothetical protein
MDCIYKNFQLLYFQIHLSLINLFASDEVCVHEINQVMTTFFKTLRISNSKWVGPWPFIFVASTIEMNKDYRESIVDQHLPVN